MIRVLLFVVLVFLLAAGFAWLADRPGDVVLHWQGYEIRTSLMIAAVGLAVLIAALAVVGAAIRAIVHAPRAFESFLGARRRDRGYRALSTGMIAVGAGDARTARKAADDARTHLGDAPLALLLSAQAAQLSGDGGRARIAFEALSARPATRILGLHGLFVEARRQGEHEAARHFAEEVTLAAPKIGWAGTALFEYQSRAGDWLGAMRTLAGNAGARLVDKTEAERLRAVLLTARAMELEAGDPVEARAAALEAHRLQPGLVPATVVAARLLTRAGDIRRATKVLEQAWRVAPHPDLAEAYALVRPGDSVRDRLKRVHRLAGLRANHPEGATAVARAAIDAHDWQTARAALEGLAKADPSERICLLMAEIEEREHGDQGRVRSWLTRAITAPRDPIWVAGGRAFDRWLPVSPISGKLGVFEWKVAGGGGPSREAALIQADLAAMTALAPPGPIAASASPRQAETTDTVTDMEPASIVGPAPGEDGREPVVEIEAEVAAETPAMPETKAAEGSGAEADGAPVAGSRGELQAAEPIRPPDDPGPDDADSTDEPRQRRFRLF